MKKTLIKEEHYLTIHSDDEKEYCSCKLKKYADENTVKAFLSIREQVIPYRFNLYGDPCFSMEIYEQYETLNIWFRDEVMNEHEYLPVVVEYEEKDFDVPLESFNTIEGITQSLTDLKAFNKMLNDRKIYCGRIKPDARLNEFIVYGLFILDCFGKVQVITDSNDHVFPEFRHRIITRSEFDLYNKSYSSTSINIPDADSQCELCGGKWSIEDLKCGSYADFTYQYHNYQEIHRKCLYAYNHEQEVNFFKEIFSEVYPGIELKYAEISNLYCYQDCCKHKPWFKFYTPDGEIKIGWRRKVIGIKWSENYKPFSHTFENENVKRGFGHLRISDRFIHAWGKEKAIEYLLAARNSIR